MIPGIPGGRQLAVSLSSRPAARIASLLAAYAGVSDGPAGAPAPRLPAAGAAPRFPPPPKPTSQTPVKSGSLAMASQSATVGALGGAFCPDAAEPTETIMTNAKTI